MRLLSMLLLFVFYNIFNMLTMSETAVADDELYLCGVVKEVNSEERKVSIQVISEGCSGKKIFNVSKTLQLGKFITGKNTCFTIDANVCPQHKIATILEM